MSPRRQATTRPLPRPRAAEIDEQTALGQVYVDALVRTQLRLALRFVAAVAGLLAALDVTIRLVPQVHEKSVGPVPLTWAVLGFGVYVVLLLAAWAYLWATERVEREFAALVRGD